MPIKIFLSSLALSLSVSLLVAQENSLPPSQFNRYLNKQGVILVDVRTPTEWRAGRIIGARLQNVQEVDSFKAAIETWDRTKTYLLYCRSGKRSQRAMEILNSNGFSNVYDLEGGFVAWEKSKLGKGGKIISPTHKLVIQVSSGDSLVWKGLMNNLKHLQMGWGDSAQIVVIAHGQGLDLFRKDVSNQLDKINLFSKMGIQFNACENTMTERKVTKEMLAKEVGTVKMGLGEIVHLQELGWSYLKAGF
ncbi:MAG: hypothetical protein EBR19_06075 [Chitinophagaceae bacterium]|jgi:uncharacterized protein|nr:hypothetical protein [Chitinophagaceae bacterium]